MRNFNIALVFCATVGLGLLLGCSSEYPATLPVSQTFDTLNENTLRNTSLSSSTASTASTTSTASTPETKVKSLINLGKGQDLRELVVKAPGVVLLDFHATWCGPCVKQGKVLHGLENFASQKKASIIKVDVDQHEELASLFDVSALPTLMLIKDGKIVERQSGLASENRITEFLSR